VRLLPKSGGVRALLLAIVLGVPAVAGWMMLRNGTPPSLATGAVTRGDFVEFVEIRGEIRPIKSVVVASPMQSGELQILKIAANGSAIKKDDVVIVFDEAPIRMQILNVQSQLRQAQAALDQFYAQQRIAQQQDETALMKARNDVSRARLGLGDPRVSSKVDIERGKLALQDSEAKLHEVEQLSESRRLTAGTDVGSRDRQIEKLKADIVRLEASIGALQVKAPADGTINIMPNYRTASQSGMPPEFRAGDKVFPGGQVLELPDLSSVNLMARLDEADRGRLQIGQIAMIRADAVAEKQFEATVEDISLLARVDFMSGWPPVKNFDLKLTFKERDERLRPGMSAAARIEVGRVPDMLIVPAESVFAADGKMVVYRLAGNLFEAVPIEIIRRNREQAAVKGRLAASDRIALTRPDERITKGGS